MKSRRLTDNKEGIGRSARFFVLGGAGIIGRTVVADLANYAKGAEIIVGERDLKKATAYVRTLKAKNVCAVAADASDVAQLEQAFHGCDVVLSCVQYTFNPNVMQACLQTGAHYVDLGGMFHYTRKELALHDQFVRRGVTAILGIGAAPGISNVLAAYGARDVKQVKSVDIVFADVDITKYNQPFVLPYSFKTLIEEYTLEPVVFRGGKLVFVAPESGKKVYDFGPEFGKQAGFLTLHSELATLPAYFKERSIRQCEFRVTFPEVFTQTIETLIKLGFASVKTVEVNGESEKIINVTARIMDQWIPKAGTNIRDKELVRVILNERIVMDALTESDGVYPAGVLDTGIPCSIAAQLLASGAVRKPGVYAPESILEPEAFFGELGKRGIKVLKNGKRVN